MNWNSKSLKMHLILSKNISQRLAIFQHRLKKLTAAAVWKTVVALP